MKIIFIATNSDSNFIEMFGRILQIQFEIHKIQLITINLSKYENIESALRNLVAMNADLVISFGGLLSSAKYNSQCFWEVFKLPLIAIHGDSPCHNPINHYYESIWVANLYGFTEHYDYATENSNNCLGIVDKAPPIIFPRLASQAQAIPIANKRLYYPKNSASMDDLKKTYYELLAAPQLVNFFSNIEERIQSNLDDINHSKLVMLIKDAIHCEQSLFDIILRYLDSFSRISKHHTLLNSLIKFPIDICGNGYGTMYGKHKHARIINQSDFNLSNNLINSCLGIVHLSPNSDYDFHDRQSRALGMQKIVFMNNQKREFFNFEIDGLFFKFNESDIEKKLDYIFTNQNFILELGKYQKEEFEKIASFDVFKNKILKIYEKIIK